MSIKIGTTTVDDVQLKLNGTTTALDKVNVIKNGVTTTVWARRYYVAITFSNASVTINGVSITSGTRNYYDYDTAITIKVSPYTNYYISSGNGDNTYTTTINGNQTVSTGKTYSFTLKNTNINLAYTTARYYVYEIDTMPNITAKGSITYSATGYKQTIDFGDGYTGDFYYTGTLTPNFYFYSNPFNGTYNIYWGGGVYSQTGVVDGRPAVITGISGFSDMYLTENIYEHNFTGTKQLYAKAEVSTDSGDNAVTNEDKYITVSWTYVSTIYLTSSTDFSFTVSNDYTSFGVDPYNEPEVILLPDGATGNTLNFSKTNYDITPSSVSEWSTTGTPKSYNITTKLKQFTVKVSYSDGISATINGGGTSSSGAVTSTLDYGTKVTVVVTTPTSGWYYISTGSGGVGSDSITIDDTTQYRTYTYTIDSLTSDVSLSYGTSEYRKLTVTADNASITMNNVSVISGGARYYTKGATVDIVVSANNGYYIGSGYSDSRSDSILINGTTKYRTYTFATELNSSTSLTYTMNQYHSLTLTYGTGASATVNGNAVSSGAPLYFDAGTLINKFQVSTGSNYYYFTSGVGDKSNGITVDGTTYYRLYDRQSFYLTQDLAYNYPTAGYGAYSVSIDNFDHAYSILNGSTAMTSGVVVNITEGKSLTLSTVANSGYYLITSLGTNVNTITLNDTQTVPIQINYTTTATRGNNVISISTEPYYIYTPVVDTGGATITVNGYTTSPGADRYYSEGESVSTVITASTNYYLTSGSYSSRSNSIIIDNTTKYRQYKYNMTMGTSDVEQTWSTAQYRYVYITAGTGANLSVGGVSVSSGVYRYFTYGKSVSIIANITGYYYFTSGTGTKSSILVLDDGTGTVYKQYQYTISSLTSNTSLSYPTTGYGLYTVLINDGDESNSTITMNGVTKSNGGTLALSIGKSVSTTVVADSNYYYSSHSAGTGSNPVTISGTTYYRTYSYSTTSTVGYHELTYTTTYYSTNISVYMTAGSGSAKVKIAYSDSSTSWSKTNIYTNQSTTLGTAPATASNRKLTITWLNYWSGEEVEVYVNGTNVAWLSYTTDEKIISLSNTLSEIKILCNVYTIEED